jgi:hypothetical protein
METEDGKVNGLFFGSTPILNTLKTLVTMSSKGFFVFVLVRSELVGILE